MTNYLKNTFAFLCLTASLIIIPDCSRISPKTTDPPAPPLSSSISTLTLLYQPSARAALGTADTLITLFIDSNPDLKTLAPDSLVARLNAFIYDSLKIEFDADRNLASSLFPASAITTRKGTCVGISLIYLLIAQRASLPLFGVMVPGHFFVRYDNGTTRINIESLKRGAPRSDQWYREKFPLSDSNHIYLTNLSNPQITAIMFYNIGNIFSANDMHKLAVYAYQQSLVLMPQFGEAWGNRAIAFEALSQRDSSRYCLEQAYALPGPDAKVYYNLGALYLRVNDAARAATVLQQGIERYPRDADIAYCLGFIKYLAKDNARAVELLKIAIKEKPDFVIAKSLLTTVQKTVRTPHTGQP